MKWSLLLLLLPLLSTAQGVKRNQYDAFLQKQTVELEPVILLADGTNRLTVTFSAEASDLYVQVSGSGWGATTIDDGDELRFLLANDSAVAVKAAGLQSFEPGLNRSTYRHQYRITPAALQALSRADVVALRKFSFKESSDLRLPPAQKAKLQTASALFLTEFKKTGGRKPLRQVNARDVLACIGDSVAFCSRVYNVRSGNRANGATVLELQADFSDPIVQVIFEEGNTTAADAEKLFLNKGVCVSGVLRMQANLPTLVLRNAAQVKLNEPATNK